MPLEIIKFVALLSLKSSLYGKFIVLKTGEVIGSTFTARTLSDVIPDAISIARTENQLSSPLTSPLKVYVGSVTVATRSNL